MIYIEFFGKSKLNKLLIIMDTFNKKIYYVKYVLLTHSLYYRYRTLLPDFNALFDINIDVIHRITKSKHAKHIRFQWVRVT